MLRHLSRMASVFPFSKLAQRGPVLRIYAIEHTEPAQFEREFTPGTEVKTILDSIREISIEDCAVEIDAHWDLLDHNGEEWKLAPVPVTLAAFGTAFDNEQGDHLRIEFGLDAKFLPPAGIEGAMRAGESNIRSLLHLVDEIQRVVKPERRALWSESGANFAEVLRRTLGGIHVN